MKYLKSYQLFEAHGVAEATLIYNQFLLDEFNKYCDIALENGDKNYSNSVNYTKEDLTQFIQTDVWPKYPISSMEVTYTLQTMTDEDWIKRFPTSTKKYIGTGACYNIDEEGGSSIKPAIDDRSDVTIHLKLEIGALISDVFNNREGLSLEIESSITHELNHGYEGWNRMRKGKGQVSTDVTWALDVNRSKIRKDIWKIWYDEIGYYVYWSELHEINAMTQDAYPYVKRYDIDEVKEKAPSWKFATKMKNFDANDFKQRMTDKILTVYPDADVDIMLSRIKNGFANELIKNRENSINNKEDKPTLSGESVKSMSVDKFLTFIQNRINRAGNRIQRNILKLYSLK
jgi:hypothetical protein